MEIKHLSKEQVLGIYYEIIEKFGKAKGVIEMGNLEYAVLRCESFRAKNEQEEVIWKAAILLERIVNWHPFIDGNKRTAWQTAKTFLELNGYSIDAEEEETVLFLLELAEKRKGIHFVKSWLGKKCKKVL